MGAVFRFHTPCPTVEVLEKSVARGNVGVTMPTVGCEVLMTPSMLAVPWVVNEIVPVGAGPESPPLEKVPFRAITSFPNAIPLLIPPLTSPLLKVVMVY